MSVVRPVTAILLFAIPLAVFGQANSSSAPTPLAELLKEASRNNAQIAVADESWKAAQQVPTQASSLPGPTFTYQQFSVGSPKPFAGYTNSDFSYVGVGVSQEVPYPGKLRLRGEEAERAADVKAIETDATRANIAGAVKSDYLELSYLQGTLGLFKQNESVLDQLIQDAIAHYKVGQGLQDDVLKAQIERTKLVRELTTRHERMGRIEAHLKELLHRDQNSPDIVAEPIEENPLRISSAELLQMVRTGNPQVQVDSSAIRREDAALASAKRDGKPDFYLGYMYENTDRKYRDYYMFTLNVHLPSRSRSKAKVAEAAVKMEQSKQALDAHLQQQLAQAKQDFVTVTSDEELLKEYREGLIPQSEAAYRSTLNAYASGRDPFTDVLLSFENVLDVKLDEARVLANHEEALAQLETLTGAELR